MVAVTDIVLTGLSVFVVSFMIHSLDGPFDVFKKLREHYGVYYDDNGDTHVESDGFMAKLLSCYWCTATWVGILLCIVYIVVFPLLFMYYIFLALASIAIAGIVYTYVMR